MRPNLVKTEERVSKGPEASEKVLAAYEFASAFDFLVRRPRTYHLTGPAPKEPPAAGLPVTLVGRIGQYTSHRRDRLAFVVAVLDVPAMGGVSLSWVSSAAKGKATEIALSTRCPVDTMALATGIAHYSRNGYLTLRNAEVEPASSAALEAVASGRILPIPVYPLTKGLRQSEVRSAARSYLRAGFTALKDAMPNELEALLRLPALVNAFEVVHGLTAVDGHEAQLLLQNRSRYQRRIDVERLWALMAHMPQLSATPPAALALRERSLDVLSGLTFPLTLGQVAATNEVFDDLSRPCVTRRLLQGDVGCGKSIVALLALIAGARSGAPAALLAPTEVLARQLHRGAELLAKQIGISTHFVTGTLGAPRRRAVEDYAARGDPAIFVGTHALASLPFSRLGVLVIDEEHRFGVELKERLMALNPHVITMSATPIPRSLASVLYVGHSVSSITERPPGRQPVQTQVVQNETKEVGWIDRMRQTLRKEQQVFVVCPSIASQEIANVTDTANTLQSHLGAQSVRVLHGDMDSKDIERTLTDFRDNRFGVLVATTFIEVGIDVPRATLMVIRDPERLGLSQLHQIRGRVGRGSEPGSCMLLTRCSGAARERLDFFARTQDGFALAEMDMHNRGAGDLGGLDQSGFLDVNLLALGEEATTIQRFLTRNLTSDPELWLDQVRFEVSI